MVDRKEYFKDYYARNKRTIIREAKKYYQEHKKECLTNHKTYYKINREDILAKKKMKELSFKGHAQNIWRCVNKYARVWKLPMCEFEELWDWTKDDPTYEQLWNAWRDSGYSEYNSPVLMRNVKKQGWENKENLKWDTKKNYSWWNEDSTIFKTVSANLEEQQKERNKSSKEWRKKIREEFKAKQKAKRCQ